MTETLDYIVEESEDEMETFPRGDIISESSLKTFFRCHYGYYLSAFLGMSRAPISGFAAQSLFFKIQRKKLFPETARAGPLLKPVEKMSENELKEALKFHSPESCGNGWLGRWQHSIKDQVYIGRRLAWSFDSQPFTISQTLRNAGRNYYQFILENHAPVFGFVNKRQSFVFEGTTFIVEFPELRKGMLIDNLSLGNMENLDSSSLVTLRILALCTIAHEFNDDPLYREKLGLEDQVVESWGGNPIHVDPRITYRNINCGKNGIQTTSRSDENLDKFRKVVEMFQEGVAREDFYPNHQSCNSCPYNAIGLDGKLICGERKEGLKPSMPIAYFRKTAFNIQTEEQDGKITLKGIVSWKETSPKLVATLTLVLEGDKVKTFYETDIHGHGFEQRMIDAAEQSVQSLANKTRRNLDHSFDYKRNFDCAGKESIAKKLVEIGYKNDSRIYKPNALF